MSRPERRGPPAWLERALGRWIPEGASGRASVLGDLHEEYLRVRGRRGRLASDLWYAAQVSALGVPWAFRALGVRLLEATSGLVLDLRATLRGLRRAPVLVGVGVLSLALGSGLVTAAATLVNGAWFAPLPWPEPDRLIDLEDTHPTEVCRDCSPGTSFRAYTAWQEELGGVFDRIEATDRQRVTLRIGNLPVDVVVMSATPGLPELLDLDTGLGRLFGVEDTEIGSEPVTVLTFEAWQRLFGEDPSAVGEVVELDGIRHTVVGVLRPAARPLYQADLLVPIRRDQEVGGFDDRGLWVIGRLAPGVGLAAADEALAALATGLYAEDPALEPGWSARATPLRTVLARSGAAPSTAFALVALCLIVLLVAALNLAALLLARVTQRAQELGVRSALGAGRIRIARAAVLDALLLAGAGGVGGVFLTWMARDAVIATFAAELPPWVSFPIDLRVLGATIASVALIAAVTGLLPLVRSWAHAREREGAPTSRGGRARAPDLLLGAQIVLGVVLVAGSFGALRTFRTVSDFDRLGHRWSGLTNVSLQVPAPPAAEGTSVAELARRLDDALDAHPGLEGHALSRTLFLGSWGTEDAESPVRVSGAPEPMRNDRVPRHSLAVGPRYFELNEIPILAGRGIARTDGPGAGPVAVVSQGAARSMWPDRMDADVVGASFTLTVGETSETFTVVGVAAPVVSRAWSEDSVADPRIYTALSQTRDGLYAGSPGGGLLLRVDPRGTPPSAESWAVWLDEVAPEAAIQSVDDVEGVLRASIRGIWLTGVVLGGLSALVLALLCIGIFGTVSYRIASRRKDIGIRIALGADGGRVIRAVGGRLARVVVASLGAGAALAWAADRVLAAGGVPVGDADPVVLGSVAVLIGLAAALACALPIRRALAIDPVRSMRVE